MDQRQGGTGAAGGARRRWRGEPALGVVAAVLMGAAAITLAVAIGRAGAVNAMPETRRESAVPTTATHAASQDAAELFATWRRWAAHGLLVPLLDSEGPVAWAVPSEMQPCRDEASARLDGQPLEPGRRLPVGVPLHLSLHLVDCWPLGADWLGLDGDVALELVVHPDAIDVRVSPLGLRAAVAGRRVVLTDAVATRIALEPELRP